MERGSRKRSSSARSEKMERVGDRQEKMEGYFDRPKPTAGCSANGEENKKKKKKKKKSPDYRNQHMRANAWKEIGKELSSSDVSSRDVSSRDVRIMYPRLKSVTHIRRLFQT
jgi:hypothetical protein